MLLRYFSVLVGNFAAWLPKLIQFGAKKITEELAWIGGVWWQKLLALVFGKEILDLFQINKAIAQALKDIMGTTTDTLINTWKLIAAMLKSIVGMYGNLIAATQATDIEDVGFLTDCTGLSSSEVMYPICVGLGLTDYAVASFPAALAMLVVVHGVIDYLMIKQSLMMLKKAIS
jgi:hypothetical protein